MRIMKRAKCWSFALYAIDEIYYRVEKTILVDLGIRQEKNEKILLITESSRSLR